VSIFYLLYAVKVFEYVVMYCGFVIGSNIDI